MNLEGDTDIQSIASILQVKKPRHREVSEQPEVTQWQWRYPDPSRLAPQSLHLQQARLPLAGRVIATELEKDYSQQEI